MLEQHLIDGSSSSIPCSNILCSELKQLYVAITRTRQRLWICENSKDPKPMFEYWMAKGVVQVQDVDASLAQKMKVASTPDEWIARGFKLLGEKSYEAASTCFERAGFDYGVNLAKAAGFKASAERLHGSNPKMAYDYRRKAAEIFESIGKADYAAECFYMLTEYEKAGKLYYQCGDSAMRRAGECFSLAGCFNLAAESYFKADCLNECLIACEKGKLFDQGLRYIQAWRRQMKGDNSKNKKKRETEICEQEFLERCAYHFHKLNDKESMMNCVRTFSAECRLQNFLRTYEYYDELVSFEVEGGHFLEAAAAAKLKGDLCLEADLLGKAHCFKDASKLLLQSVLVRALWSGQSKGWPPKKFNQMVELLEKAKSFSEKVSPEHHQVVSLEADILINGHCNLSLLMQHLNISKILNCTRAEIVCCRMILDVHFSVTTSNYLWHNDLVADVSQFSKGMLSGGQVSCETLVYMWNLWKENISSIFDYLVQAASTDVDRYQAHGEFCLNFLGARKENENTRQVIYTLINPQADWVQGLGPSLRKKGACKAMDVQNFVSAARKYWSSEFLLVGMKVLANLEEIYNLATKNSVSHFCRAKCLAHIFEVANFLLHCTFVLTGPHNDALQKSIRRSSESLFRCIYPLDCRESLQDPMICFRRTETFRNFLSHVILGYVNSKNKLSYGKLGDITLMILGSGRLDQDLCQKIMKGLNCAPAWKSLLSHLCNDPQTNSRKASENLLMLLLHRALMDTYNVEWKTEVDYMTPSCLFFLIERQLIELSSTNGYFFSTTSSVVEWLVFQGNGDFQIKRSPENETQPRETMVQFLCSIVHDFFYNMDDTKLWIAKYHTKDRYAILVSRVVIVMCMLYLNFGQCKDLLAHVIYIDRVSRLLPSELSGALQSGLRCSSFDGFAYVVARALREIGNPLVLVGQVKDCPKIQNGSGIIYIGEIRDAEDTLRILLQEKSNPHQKYETNQSNVLFPIVNKVPGDDIGNATCSSAGVVSMSGGSNQGAVSDLESKNPSSENGALKSRILILLSALAEDKASLPAKDKVALEKLFLQFCDTLDSCMRKNLSDNEINLHFKEASLILEEVEHLFALWDASNSRPEVSSDDQIVGELLDKIRSRMSRTEAALLEIHTQNIGSPDAANTDDKKPAACNASKQVVNASVGAPEGDGSDAADTDDKQTGVCCEEEDDGNNDGSSSDTKQVVNASLGARRDGFPSKGKANSRNKKKNKKGKRR